MELRSYQLGDERAQVEVFNEAAAGLPGFKPAAPEELARRWRSLDAGAILRHYAVVDGEVAGYAMLNSNGRISYPWCRPGAEGARKPLLEALLSAAARRGLSSVWTAYRDDWTKVLGFFQEQGFQRVRDQINYTADLHDLPKFPSARRAVLSPMSRDEFRQVALIAPEVMREVDLFLAARFYAENLFFPPSALFALNDTKDGHLRGLGLAITDPRFADPMAVDPHMPCFRLGAFGTERERHKRIRGMCSFLFEAPEDAEILLGEAVRRLRAAGLVHAAAQAPSDAPRFVSFYDHYFKRQGSFPILSLKLAADGAQGTDVAGSAAAWPEETDTLAEDGS